MKYKELMEGLLGEADEIAFELSAKIIPLLDKEFEKTEPEFAKFILRTDMNTRMRHGIEINSRRVVVSDWVDNCSTGYRAEVLELTKPPKNIKELAALIKKSNLIPFIKDVRRRADAYNQGFADYIKRTGGHHGNPVWMD